LTISRLI